MWFSQCLVGTRQNPRRRGLTKVGRCRGVGGRAESKTAGENVGRMSELGNHCKSCTSEQPHQQPSAAAAMRIVPRRDESCWLALFPSVLCFSDPLHACSEEDTAAEIAFSSRASQSPAFGGTAMRRRTDRRAISFCRVVFFSWVEYYQAMISLNTSHRRWPGQSVVMSLRCFVTNFFLAQIRDDASFSNRRLPLTLCTLALYSPSPRATRSGIPA